MEIKEIKISEIKPNKSQPRKSFDKEEIKNLALSIKEKGLLQPITINKQNELIIGERRVRALKILNENTVNAIVLDVDDLTAKEISLIENWHRADLTSVEKENALWDLWNSGKYESKLELGKKLGLSERHIGRIIEARNFRKKTDAASVSTHTISDTVGLSDKERIDIIEKVSKGELASSKVRDIVRLKKFEKTLPERRELPQIKKTPEDYVQSLSTELMKIWEYVGVDFPENKVDEILKFVAGQLTQEQKSELTILIDKTVFALERFQKALAR